MNSSSILYYSTPFWFRIIRLHHQWKLVSASKQNNNFIPSLLSSMKLVSYSSAQTDDVATKPATQRKQTVRAQSSIHVDIFSIWEPKRPK